MKTQAPPRPPQRGAVDAIGPQDPRYAYLAHRGFNKRFLGKPEVMCLVASTEQAVDAVADAVRDGQRVVARSGGHCLEGFVDDPAVKVLVDTSLMTGVDYDPRMSAFAVEAGATACNVGWLDPRDEARNLAWVRAFYRELFADSGGVPAPGPASDGALINHADADLADPELNTSGVPWHTLYYKDNYPRLQRIKARWDPRNVFHHALSIRA